MIIEVTFMKSDGTDKTIMKLEGAWKIDGPMSLTPRVIWFMNAIQEISKEFKRRDNAAAKNLEKIPNGNK